MLRFRPLLPVLLTAISVSACGGSDEKTPALPVQQASVLEATFSEDIDTVSTLEASDLVELAAQTSGRVTELKVSQGDSIKAGQLLVVLDQVQARAALAEQRAVAATAKVDWEREEYLAKVGAASLRQRDTYRLRYVAALEKVKTLEAELSYSNLRSPTAGTIAEIRVKVGDVVNQNQSFTSVVQNNILEAKVEVPAVYGDRLAIGQPVILSAPGTVKPLATSQIESIDPQVNPQTQGLLVKAFFNNDDGKLRSGQRLRTRVQLKSGQQISVPFAAVTQTSGQSFVFRVGSFADLKASPGKADIERISQGIEKGKLPKNALFALQTPVNVGEIQNNRYPVMKGLKLNEKVVTTNLLNLKHGMPIQVKTQRAGSQPAAAKN